MRNISNSIGKFVDINYILYIGTCKAAARRGIIKATIRFKNQNKDINIGDWDTADNQVKATVYDFGMGLYLIKLIKCDILYNNPQLKHISEIRFF